MKAHLTADVAVIGGGPAGISAAATAAEAGLRVVLVDENANVGGQIWRYRNGMQSERRAQKWLARLIASGASRLHGASVVDARMTTNGLFQIALETRAAAAEVTAAKIILATGARERFLPFPGWTLPGVVGVGAAQALLKSGTAFSGKRVVIAGSGPLLLPVAASLSTNGAAVKMVAEQAPAPRVRAFARSLWKSPTRLALAAKYRSRFFATPYKPGWWIVRADGESTLRSVTITNGRKQRTIDCDVLCCAYGLVPNVELARMLGCDLGADGVIVDARCQTSVGNVFSAGELNGIGGAELAIAEGVAAGASAAGNEALLRKHVPRIARLRREARVMNEAFSLREELRTLAMPETIVCRCEDVSLGQLNRAWTARQAKLYTRCGMGACQGRVCGYALEFLFGWPADSVRTPILAAKVATLARHDGSPNSHLLEQQQ